MPITPTQHRFSGGESARVRGGESARVSTPGALPEGLPEDRQKQPGKQPCPNQ
jgi:hypothetical protein